MSWKDGLFKQIVLEYDLSCIIGKDDISFSRKHDLFALDRKRKTASPSRKYMETWRIAQRKKKHETWYIESKFGLSLNLSGWTYSIMNNLQYLVPFSLQGSCFRSNYQECSVKKVLLEILQNSQENICARASFLIKFRCLQICTNTFFTEHVWATAFGVWGHAWAPAWKTIYP